MAENVSLLSSPANGQEYSSTQPTAPTGPPPPYADHCDAAAAQGQAARLPQYQPPGHVTGINATVLRATPQLTSPAYNDIDRSDGSHFSSRRIFRSYFMAVTLSFVWGFFCLPGLLFCTIPAILYAKKSMRASSAGDTRSASQYSQVSIVCSVTSLMIGVLIQLVILAWGSFMLVGVIINIHLAHQSQSPPITCPCSYYDTKCCW